MKVLFVISNSDTAFWLSEVTHPYWHLTETRSPKSILEARRVARSCSILTAIPTSRNQQSRTTW